MLRMHNMHNIHNIIITRVQYIVTMVIPLNKSVIIIYDCCSVLKHFQGVCNNDFTPRGVDT